MTSPNQWRCFNGQKKQREQSTSLTSGGGGVRGGGGEGGLLHVYIYKKNMKQKASYQRHVFHFLIRQ